MDINITQHRILKYIWKKRRTVRKEISEYLNVNPSTVTRNLADLLKVGIVRSYGFISTSRTVGRKSELIGIDEQWRRIVGISIERGEITTLLVSLTGEILEKKRDFMEVNSENIVGVISNAVSYFKDSGHVVSIAVPGIVSNGVIVFSMALGIKNLDLKSAIEKISGKRVYVVNDANAVSANFSDEAENLVCFLLSIPYNLSEEVGMGAGLWLNGKLYQGSHSAAGESGSGFRVVEKSGTIEDLKSGRFKPSEMEKFVKLIGGKIALLSQFLDPDLVVISGDVDLLPERSKRKLLSEVRKNLISNIEITIDTGGSESIARGAAMALVNEMMNNIEMMKNYIWF